MRATRVPDPPASRFKHQPWSGCHPMSLPNCSKTLPTPPPLAVPLASIEAGESLIPWEQVKTEAGL